MKIIKKKGNIVKILIIMLIATISLYILSISSYAADMSWNQYRQKYYKNGKWDFNGISNEELNNMKQKMQNEMYDAKTNINKNDDEKYKELEKASKIYEEVQTAMDKEIESRKKQEENYVKKDSGGKTESGVGGGFGEIIESITDDYVTKSDGTINPDDYKPKYADQTIGSYRIKTMANRIIGTIQIIGSILSVAVLGILGIKYMIGSVEERAEYKKTLKAYVIGAIMVFGIINILAIIVKISTNVFSN